MRKKKQEMLKTQIECQKVRRIFFWVFLMFELFPAHVLPLTSWGILLFFAFVSIRH